MRRVIFGFLSLLMMTFPLLGQTLTVEAGKLADIVAVPGDPLSDVSVMEKLIS